MFRKLGKVVVHHPIWTICSWIVVAVLVVMLAPQLKTSNDESDFLPKNYESIQSMQIGSDKFASDKQPDGIGVFSRTDGKALTPADMQKACQAVDTLKADKNATVGAIDSSACTALASASKGAPASASSGSTGAGKPAETKVITAMMFAADDADMSGMSPQVAEDVTKLRDDGNAALSGTGLRFGVAGNLGMTADVHDSTGTAEMIVTLATVLLIIVLLAVIFRSPIAALLPIVMITLLIGLSNSAMAWINDLFNLNAMSMISVILAVVMFGIGTDYYLFLMFRYRERLRLGDDPKTAMVKAVGRVGEAIASAASVVIVAFAVLAFSSMGMMKSMGPDLAISVFVMFCASVTLTPALVSLIGPKAMFWPSKAWMTEPSGTHFAAIGRFVAKRAGAVAAAATILMIVIASFALGFKANFDFSSSTLPKTADSVVTQDILKNSVGSGIISPTSVYLDSTDGGRLTDAEIARFGTTLAGIKGVTQVVPQLDDSGRPVTDPQGQPVLAKLSKDGLTADYTLYLANDPGSNAAFSFVRDVLKPQAHDAAPNGTRALVGGEVSIYLDVDAAMNRDYSVVFPIAALLIFLILAFQLRSLVAPIYLVAAVALGFTATLGVSVLAFQVFGGEPGLLFMMPLIMYMFVVAIGTDYNILMITRLREEARNGRPPREAAAEAIKHAGPTIAAAAVILAGSFASLTLAGNGMMMQMGFSIAAGIVIVAFIMALFFTPSFTARIGHGAWWPGHQDVRRTVPHPPLPTARTEVQAEPVSERD